MQKQVVVRDAVVAQLDVIRGKHKCSYHTAIELLLKKEPFDLRLVEINDLFTKLTIIVPEDMHTMVEVFRVVVVRNYRRDPEERSNDRDFTNDILEKLINTLIGGRDHDRAIPENV